jgi:hypothetical protein
MGENEVRPPWGRFPFDMESRRPLLRAPVPVTEYALRKDRVERLRPDNPKTLFVVS